jgi:hydroxyacylglutathione hydrolase
MEIYKFTVGNFGVNNYLVHSEESSQALLIDAGEDPHPILNKINQLDLELIYLVNTHGHGDHIAGNQKIVTETGARLLIHEKDATYLSDPHLNLSAFMGFNLHSPPANCLLKDGESLELDDLRFKILHTPGHSPGHISLVSDGVAFVGDVIFQGGIGRTDFPESSSQQLLDSIRNVIYRLPEDTILYPGHGPNTTVKNEKQTNPFVSI